MRTHVPVVLFVSILVLAVNGHPADQQDVSVEVKERIDSIQKSDQDKRVYRGLVLSNDLKVILISDPETDQAAAAMTISIGGMQDFVEVPGIAHFLEHMLFMGSKKYPAENHFSKFVRDHAGTYNGLTGEGLQGYYFSIAHENLAEALDIFAQFFLDPLMDPSSTQREMNAVESEHAMYRAQDDWRLYHLLKSLSNSSHPYGRFFCGNKKTLSTDPEARGVDVRKKLLELHSKWYSSNIMRLSVLGRESLDDLERMVVPLFKNIMNKNLEKPTFSEHPWGPAQLGKKIYAVPTSNKRYIQLEFALPDAIKHYKTAPMRYIGDLIGHEGPGSLIAELRRRHWCDSIGTTDSPYPGFSFFSIRIELSEDTLHHVDDIVKLVFQYLKLLRTKGAQEWYFKELQKTRETRFRFKDKENPMDYMLQISSSMLDFPIQDVLSHHYIQSEWNPRLIDEFLSYLTPTNMSVLIVSKKVETFPDLQVEAWHNTKYKVEKIPQDLIDEWSTVEPLENFHLPPPNEFIATKFDLKPLDRNTSHQPHLIHQSKRSQIWFQQDDKFKVPKIFVRLNLFSPLTCVSVKERVLSALFTKLFTKAFTPYAYAASLAGLNWETAVIRCGLQVYVSGYTEKIPAFLQRLLSEIKTFELDESYFEIAKDAEILNRKNFENDKPYTQALSYMTYILDNMTHSNKEILEATQSVKAHDMKQFMKLVFHRVFVQGLIYGDCNNELAKEIINIVEKAFESEHAVLPHEIPSPSIVKMANKSEYIYEATNDFHENSGYVAYFQCDTQHPIVNSVMADVFLTIIGEKCFQVLRTEMQLGYVVGCKAAPRQGVLGFLVLVQSIQHPESVNTYVETFLDKLYGTLENMTDTQFEVYKTSMKNKYLEKVNGPAEQMNLYWDEISQRRYHFERKAAKAKELSALKKADILKFYKEYIQLSSDKRKKLNIHVISNVTKPVAPADVIRRGSKIENVAAFKNSSSFYPPPHSYMDVPPVGTKF